MPAQPLVDAKQAALAHYGRLVVLAEDAASGGASVGLVYVNGAGTFGCLVEDPAGDRYLLSNNHVDKGRRGRFSEHAGRNASERRAGLETGNAEADPPVMRGRLPSDEKRATRAPSDSARVMVVARMQGGDGGSTGSPGGVVARDNRTPARAGPFGVPRRTQETIVVPVAATLAHYPPSRP